MNVELKHITFIIWGVIFVLAIINIWITVPSFTYSPYACDWSGVSVGTSIAQNGTSTLPSDSTGSMMYPPYYYPYYYTYDAFPHTRLWQTLFILAVFNILLTYYSEKHKPVVN